MTALRPHFHLSYRWGASCPGGFEARSLPGFFSISAQRGIVVPCSAPAEKRCSGWDPVSFGTTCGSGYTGEECAACAPDYYLRPDRTCDKCPADQTASLLSKAALFLLIVLLEAAIIVWYLWRYAHMSNWQMFRATKVRQKTKMFDRAMFGRAINPEC